MTKRFSEIDAVRWTCNGFVVAIHFIIPLGSGCRNGLEYSFWKFISQVVAPIAMPTLFFISGYLFYVGIGSGLLDKLRRRVGRLLVPYILWNLIVGVSFASLCMFGLCKAASADLTSPSQLILWLIHKTISLWAAPADMPTWYIRTVFIYSLLSPIWLLFMRGRYWQIRLVVLLVGISGFDIYLKIAGRTVDFLYTYPPYSLFCFCVGGALAVHGSNLSYLYGKRRIFLAFVGISALIVCANYRCLHVLTCCLNLLQCMILFAFAPELMRVYRYVPEFVRSSAFWLYVTHLPIFLLLGAFISKLPFKSSSILILLSIAAMVVISLGSFAIARRYFPRAYKLLNGQLII